MTRARILLPAALSLVGVWTLCSFTSAQPPASQPGPPAAPAPTPLTGKGRSLAKLEKVRLFLDLNDGAQRAGVQPEKVVERCTKLLTGSGIAVVHDPRMPMLRLRIVVIRDDSFPDAVAYIIRVAVRQHATVERLRDSTLGEMPAPPPDTLLRECVTYIAGAWTGPP